MGLLIELQNRPDQGRALQVVQLRLDLGVRHGFFAWA